MPLLNESSSIEAPKGPTSGFLPMDSSLAAVFDSAKPTLWHTRDEVEAQLSRKQEMLATCRLVLSDRQPMAASSAAH